VKQAVFKQKTSVGGSGRVILASSNKKVKRRAYVGKEAGAPLEKNEMIPRPKAKPTTPTHVRGIRTGNKPGYYEESPGHLPGGSRRPAARRAGDILDLTLAGRAGVIEGVEEDEAGNFHVSVILDDDPGRDLAAARHPAHRFLFVPDEVEPIEEKTELSGSRRVLVAGIGNLFFGDDGFGPAVAQHLSGVDLPQGVDVFDFGIRGVDLSYALGKRYDAAILVDAVPPAGLPGRLHLIELDAPGKEERVVFDGHRMDPLAVLGTAHRLGGLSGGDRPRSGTMHTLGRQARCQTGRDRNVATGKRERKGALNEESDSLCGGRDCDPADCEEVRPGSHPGDQAGAHVRPATAADGHAGGIRADLCSRK
jgi:hydrogenase maturation protease